MSAEDRRLAYAIVQFLDRQLQSGQFKESVIETIEVSKQCLESAYDVDTTDPNTVSEFQVSKTLEDIFSEAIAEMAKAKIPESSVQQKEEADVLKTQGNDHMRAENYQEALNCYSKAIELDGRNAVYYCNRAAAHSKLNDHRKAIADCNTALQIDPTYSKAHARKGLAHTALDEHQQAVACYKMALQYDPDNQSYQNNLNIAEEKQKQSQPGPRQGAGGGMNLGGLDFTSMLSNPALMNMATSMMSNPQMQQLMSNLLSGAASSEDPNSQTGINTLLQAGQHLAQQMQQSNPELVEQLRQHTQPGRDPPGEGQGDNPDGSS